MPGAGQGLLAALGRSQAVGAIGPGPLSEHVAHAAGFLVAARVAAARAGVGFATDCSFLDLGSGGGLPGLVLAELLPLAHGTLLDGRTERARLLTEHVEALGWGSRVRVVGVRAEVAGRDPGLRGRFGLVVARGFARPAVTAECAAPLLAPGGLLVVSEPPEDAGGDRWPAAALAAFGLVPLEVVVEGDGADHPHTYQVLSQQEPCPDRWPRRTGIPAKRPRY